MSTIEITCDGKKMQFTTKSLTMDDKEYFYSKMSDIAKNTNECFYTFKYGDEVKILHYDEKSDKPLNTIFLRVYNMNMKNAKTAYLLHRDRR